MKAVTVLRVLLPWVLCARVAAPATFDVVSIKSSAPGLRGMYFTPQPGGSLRTTYITLKMLACYAYGFREFQVSGGPAWIDSERYDIDAKVESSVRPDDLRALAAEQRKVPERLQGMLADRFHLTAHRETKEGPIYGLVIAKGGPKLKEPQEGERQIVRVLPASQGKRRIDILVLSVAELAGALQNVLGHRVVDKTGITGKYDFHLEWAPDPAHEVGTPDPASVGLGASPDAPSLFTALQEQLGLRLESQRGAVEILVIDHVEKPSEN